MVLESQLKMLEWFYQCNCCWRIFSNGSNYVYSWTGPNGFTSNNEDISNLSVGTYALTVTDDNDCTKTIQFVVTEPDLLVASGVPSNYNGFEIF